MDNEQQEMQVLLKERFAALPKVVQDAITSADMESHLRELANTHKLHLDQWTVLENEVMLSLLGIQRMEDLASHIKAEVGLDESTAQALAADISRIVFTPVRQELERSLESPDSIAKATTGVENMRTQMLNAEENKPAPAVSAMPGASISPSVPAPVAPAPIAPDTSPAAAPIVPGTPPAPAPTATVERAPAPTDYVAATPSHERKTIAGDPYREQLR